MSIPDFQRAPGAASGEESDLLSELLQFWILMLAPTAGRSVTRQPVDSGRLKSGVSKSGSNSSSLIVYRIFQRIEPIDLDSLGQR